MKKVIEQLKGQVLISCQAYEDTPLYGPENMKKMAQSAILGGAKAVRSCWPQDVKAIRSISKDLIIVGIYKRIVDGKEEGTYPIITPTFEDAKSVIEAGCDIIALDCTIFPDRGKEEVRALLKQIKDAYPDIAVMADIGRYEDAEFAASTGYVDIISSTLSEYYTHSGKVDADFLGELKKIGLPVNAEGKIWDLQDMKEVISQDPWCISIGSAVTRPQLITERFIRFNQDNR